MPPTDRRLNKQQQQRSRSIIFMFVPERDEKSPFVQHDSMLPGGILLQNIGTNYEKQAC